MQLLITLFIVVLVFAEQAQGQSIIRASVGIGGSSQEVLVNNKKYTISQSIGQTGVIGTSSMGSYTIRQGFQQPLFVKHSPSKAAEELSAIIYPNPFLELINIAFTDIVEGEITVKVIDMTGRLLLNERHAPVQLLTLPIEKMAAGNYIIQVISGQKATTSSLIKQ